MSVGIPGQNLLNMALTIIARQALNYYRFAGRSLNSVGQDVTVYEPVTVIYGSFQPVPRNLYQQYGLDLQKDYYVYYTSTNNWDVQRDVSGDQIAFNGKRYQCESNTAWYALDGWNGVLCVYVGLDVADQPVWGFGSNPPNTYVNFGNGNFIGQET
jgi:hypothetical protein